MRRVVLPVHRELQLQQVQRRAAAGLEQRRGRLTFTFTRLWCGGAGVAFRRGLWGVRGGREVDRWRQVGCQRWVELVLTVNERWGCKGGMAWESSLIKRLRLHWDTPGVYLIHWMSN